MVESRWDGDVGAVGGASSLLERGGGGCPTVVDCCCVGSGGGVAVVVGWLCDGLKRLTVGMLVARGTCMCKLCDWCL